MDIQKAREILLQDKEFEKAYKTIDLALEISKMLIRARVKRDITQSQLASLLGTKQSSIARIENGRGLPNLSFLQKIAKALNMVLFPPVLMPEEEVDAKMWSSSSIYKAEYKEWTGYSAAPYSTDSGKTCSYLYNFLNI